MTENDHFDIDKTNVAALVNMLELYRADNKRMKDNLLMIKELCLIDVCSPQQVSEIFDFALMGLNENEGA